jgi:three-Cys-motif partner protein
LKNRIETLPGEPEVSLIQKRVEDAVPDIKEALPSYSAEKGLLSLCFIDPFSADLDFSVIRELGQSFKMDFLVLLMSGVDIRQNFQRYLEDKSDTRISDLIDDPNWRQDWAQRGMRARDLIHFVLEKFDAAMTRLGYEAQGPEESHPVRAHGMGVLLYHLVFYSRHPLAKKLFRAAEAGIDPQTTLGL